MKPTPSRPPEVERVALRLGFVLLHQRGSHRVYKHPSGKNVVIAFHGGGRTVPTGTLRRIIADMEITVEQFNQMV
ncbi:MAG: type II toxin-antitoxin system HicA family toxin [Planctomycetota bacterium]|nr:type II toxin-antitoxin system HicA family toxin [Planctomycetota bacterium]